MKKAIALLLLLGLICLLPSCAESAKADAPAGISVVEAQSWFHEFSVEGERVRLHCRLCLNNNTGETVSVKLYGDFKEDVGTLLNESPLKGSLKDDSAQTVFSLQPGENVFDVVFTGSFAGTAQKQTRLLPEILIELAE